MAATAFQFNVSTSFAEGCLRAAFLRRQRDLPWRPVIYNPDYGLMNLTLVFGRFIAKHSGQKLREDFRADMASDKRTALKPGYYPGAYPNTIHGDSIYEKETAEDRHHWRIKLYPDIVLFGRALLTQMPELADWSESDSSSSSDCETSSSDDNTEEVDTLSVWDDIDWSDMRAVLKVMHKKIAAAATSFQMSALQQGIPEEQAVKVGLEWARGHDRDHRENTLAIEWVPARVTFEVHEYDGQESVYWS